MLKSAIGTVECLQANHVILSSMIRLPGRSLIQQQQLLLLLVAELIMVSL